MSSSKLVVAKANELIQASYTLSMSEQRVLLLCIAKLDSRKAFVTKDYDFTLTVSDLTNEIGVVRENAYRDLRSAVNGLYKRTILLDPNEPDTEMRWLLKKAFFKNEHSVTIYFSPLIMPFLTELKERFRPIDSKM